MLELSTSVEEALTRAERSPRVDVVVFDVCLPAAEDGLRLARAIAAHSPRTKMIAMSAKAARGATFALGRLGVSLYVDKLELSLDPRAFFRALERCLGSEDELHDIAPIVRALVGRVTLSELKQTVTDAMYDEALTRGGSNRAAARLLGVQRQALQNRKRRGLVTGRSASIARGPRSAAQSRGRCSRTT